VFTREGTFRGSREPASYAIGVILNHLGVALVHGLTHSRLGMGLTVAQKIFVVAVHGRAGRGRVSPVAGQVCHGGVTRTG
jgi:hypothetical protein